MSVVCIECGELVEEVHDTTYSNINTNRAYKGQHTSDIYYCDKCDTLMIDDFLSGEVEEWSYQ